MTSRPAQWIFTAIAVLAMIAGVTLLEQARSGVGMRHDFVGETPVTVTQTAGAEGPVVVIAHGFAGSRQMMSAWALSAARAGYIAVSYDLEGHGRNPVPMSGDVTSLDGTTRILLEEMDRVVDYATALPGADGRVALIGHSMASDLIVRAGIADSRVEAIVAISMFSAAVTADEPANLLILNGQFEPALRAEAARVMAEVGAEEGETANRIARRAIAVPLAEHASVLWAPTGLEEMVGWLDQTFERESDGGIVRLGWGIVLMLAGAVMLARPLAGLLPEGAPAEALPRRVFWALALGPIVVVPPLAVAIEVGMLPVLVADYLAVHLALYGLFILIGALIAGWRPVWRGWALGFVLAIFGIGVFGFLMDRYVASFLPIPERFAIIAAMVPGAVLAMIGDGVLTRATAAALWQRIVVRVGFLASLGVAVALDFERLFFLVLIFPVIVLFYATFGMMGRWVGRRTGSAIAVGIGLGLLLGWALGVSFPMYVAG